jgi:hypothetical protein
MRVKFTWASLPCLKTPPIKTSLGETADCFSGIISASFVERRKFTIIFYFRQVFLAKFL